MFLSNPCGTYLGRTCRWKDCRPGIRISCDALHCGWRPYLHDDLRAIRIPKTLIAQPPIELWPQVVARVAAPADVEALLLAPLRDEQAKPEARPRQFGKQQPRFRFLLNPFRNRRFAICPNCERRALLRKVPLVLHVAPHNPVAIHKNCRYCPPCDLLIAHQDEVEAELAAIFDRHAPELVANSYLALGTLDRDVWKRGVAQPLPVEVMLENLHDFVEVLELRRAGVP